MGKKLTVKEIVCGGLFTALVAAGALFRFPYQEWTILPCSFYLFCWQE